MRYKTTTSNWNALDTKNAPNISFLYLFATNIYYGPFEELLEGFFTPFIFSNIINHQDIITSYGQYGKFLKGSYPLKSYKKSNVNNDKASSGGEKDKNKDKVKDKNKDENTGFSKSDADAKSDRVKKTYINTN